MILEKTPPELAKDIIHAGIYITGGGSKIQNLDQLFTEITNIKVNTCDNPEETAVRGLSKIATDSKYKRLPFSILANKTTGIINNPSRKSEPRIKPKKSEKREITKNNNIETIKKYFNVSAFAFKKSSFLKSARKNGSAAKRNICTNNNKMPPSLRTAP